MQVGSLVECVNDIPILGRWFNGLPLIKGNIYTVIQFGKSGNSIRVEEINTDWFYFKKYFREIQPPMEISIDELISEPA